MTTDTVNKITFEEAVEKYEDIQNRARKIRLRHNEESDAIYAERRQLRKDMEAAFLDWYAFNQAYDSVETCLSHNNSSQDANNPAFRFMKALITRAED